MVHALPFSIGEPGPRMSALLPSIEEAIRLGLEETRAVVAAAAPEATLLADELERAVLAGGKRLRPVLCVLAHGAAGGTAGTEILQAAAALELLHAFALVQDDVMDRAETRRGATALHRRLAASPALPPGAGESAGVVAALLVADRSSPPAASTTAHGSMRWPGSSSMSSCPRTRLWTRPARSGSER